MSRPHAAVTYGRREHRNAELQHRAEWPALSSKRSREFEELLDRTDRAILNGRSGSVATGSPAESTSLFSSRAERRRQSAVDRDNTLPWSSSHIYDMDNSSVSGSNHTSPLRRNQSLIVETSAVITEEVVTRNAFDFPVSTGDSIDCDANDIDTQTTTIVQSKYLRVKTGILTKKQLSDQTAISSNNYESTAKQATPTLVCEPIAVAQPLKIQQKTARTISWAPSTTTIVQTTTTSEHAQTLQPEGSVKYTPPLMLCLPSRLKLQNSTIDDIRANMEIIPSSPRSGGSEDLNFSFERSLLDKRPRLDRTESFPDLRDSSGSNSQTFSYEDELGSVSFRYSQYDDEGNSQEYQSNNKKKKPIKTKKQLLSFQGSNHLSQQKHQRQSGSQTRGGFYSQSRFTEQDSDSDDNQNTQQKLKSIHELRETGKNKRMQDEVMYLLDGIKSDNMRLRLLSVLDLGRKFLNSDFRRRIRSSNGYSTLLNALSQESDALIKMTLAVIVALCLRDTESVKALVLDTAALTWLIEALATPMQTDIVMMLSPTRQPSLTKTSAKYDKNQWNDLRTLLLSAVALDDNTINAHTAYIHLLVLAVHMVATFAHKASHITERIQTKLATHLAQTPAALTILLDYIVSYQESTPPLAAQLTYQALDVMECVTLHEVAIRDYVNANKTIVLVLPSLARSLYTQNNPALLVVLRLLINLTTDKAPHALELAHAGILRLVFDVLHAICSKQTERIIPESDYTKDMEGNYQSNSLHDIPSEDHDMNDKTHIFVCLGLLLNLTEASSDIKHKLCAPENDAQYLQPLLDLYAQARDDTPMSSSVGLLTGLLLTTMSNVMLVSQLKSMRARLPGGSLVPLLRHLDKLVYFTQKQNELMSGALNKSHSYLSSSRKQNHQELPPSQTLVGRQSASETVGQWLEREQRHQRSINSTTIIDRDSQMSVNASDDSQTIERNVDQSSAIETSISSSIKHVRDLKQYAVLWESLKVSEEKLSGTVCMYRLEQFLEE